MTTQISGNTGVSQVQPGSINADDFAAVLFEASKTANGYQKLPNGLILQWGTSAGIGTLANLAVNFPVAFPTGCLSVNATFTNLAGDSGAQSAVGQVRTITNSAVTIRNLGNQTNAFSWFAIGY